jgi:SAM-dependent methyltransferase
MFFSKIYKSWEGIQEEKYRKMLLGFDKDLLAATFSGRVLDVGSGSGLLERFLQKEGFDLYGWACLDPDHDMLKEGEWKHSFKGMLGDGNHLPFKPESFDNLVCLDSIHLIREDFLWVLKRGGSIMISIFCNPDNMKEKRKSLEKRLKGLEILDEFVSRGRESEIFILARKR